jgi:signal transduction histidine kinase/ActR/RegA family two-component response regulator
MFPVIKLAQYLAGLTVQQDVWAEVGRALVTFFGADLVAIGERRGAEVVLHHQTFSDKGAHARLPEHVANEAITEVLESGFLSLRLLVDPEPLSVGFLPISRENQVTAVMLIGHRMPAPLPNEWLDVYLAVAGLAATTESHLASARELREHREHLERLVLERTAELTNANDELRLEVMSRKQTEAIIQASLRLREYGLTRSPDELLAQTINEAASLTGSLVGFYGLVTPDQGTPALQCWSTGPLLNICTADEGGRPYPVHKTGVWLDCVHQRRPVIHNNGPALPHDTGSPSWHATVVRELAVPVFSGDAIVGVIGVGNKPTDYVERDVEAVSQLAHMAWDIVIGIRARNEKAALEHQLQQAQKMESVGRLAGGVAHDFNNMLGAILGHLELAIEQVDPGTPLREDLELAKHAAWRSADLTRQLLAFARRQTVALKVLDLNATVDGMLKMIERLIGEHISLAWHPSPGLWPVKMDPSQLDQVLANLCLNARDAIATVGTMTIETGNVTLDEHYCVANEGASPGDYVRLVVSDNGCGMDKETLSHLFEPFYTTKVLGKGTGLGLATVYGVIKQNHGFINVYSEPAVGTKFTLYLPRHVGCGDVVPTEVRRSAPRGHETILLVEDEPIILGMTKRMLEQQGFEVLAAGTPGEAMRQARKHVGAIHLLMTDVIMPEMNGRDLANQLLSLLPGLKLLFMSGYTANVIAHHGVLDAGVNFIEKPFSAEGLALKLRAALDADAG